ncbi:MAG: substrate-binding domain-containing protein [Treponema sp.]|nr:substrate-binding domain-containing protein [Treponema sp.]
MKKNWIILFALVFAFSSCKKKIIEYEMPPIEQTKNRLKIGFSIDTFVIERWQRDCDIFIARCNELGSDVIVQIAGNSSEKQNRQIKYLIEKEVNALVIVPKDSESLTETLKLAKEAAIPIISYDRLIRNAEISLYITIDSQKVGHLMAEEITKKVKSGKYILMYGPKEDYNMSLVKIGVEKVLKNYPAIKIIEEYNTPDWNFDLSYKKMNDLLLQKNIPDAVICGNDAVAESVLLALQENRITGVTLSGQDADIAACKRIIDGSQLMTVYKPIIELAKIASENAVRLANESDPNLFADTTMNNGLVDVPTILLEPVSVTKDNIDQVIIQSGFHTKDEIYRAQK